MKYNPLEEEKVWWEQGSRPEKPSRPLPAKHYFAHNRVRSNLAGALVRLGANNASLVLEAGCGSGEDAVYIQKVSPNIIGVDISPTALKAFTAAGFQGVLADVKNLPFRSDFFDFVICSGLLHHLIGQGNLAEYLVEFTRVTKPGGYVVALEPNVFHPSGILMNIANTIKPGITGLVPHERALSPFYLTGIFRQAGLKSEKLIAASYTWNRLPLPVSKFISKHEDSIRTRKLFNLFGWFMIVAGRKLSAEKEMK